MSEHEPPDNPRAQKALDVFVAMLDSPTEQASFVAGPATYMTQHGVDFDRLPAELHTFLVNLGGDTAGVELLGRMQSSIERSTLLERRGHGQQFATVCKF
jgi:hypothetical protein